MFAAASGARLAHRHNKNAQKQFASAQHDGSQGRNKGLPRHLQQHQHHHQTIRYSDVAACRCPGMSQRRFSSKLYSQYNAGYRLSTSYTDINGRILNVRQIDFEGKAAWQDRELIAQELGGRESVCVHSEAHSSSKLRQKEAHRRWVRKNRIQDLTQGDHDSDKDDLLYGVQSGAANLLLYVGLGTMCVGMIIAFVGTGEKGFKTMELRLIGPSLIGIGILIIILRVLLCVCPSECLHSKKKKHKLKNSASKLNSETNESESERDVANPNGVKIEMTNREKTPSQSKISQKEGTNEEGDRGHNSDTEMKSTDINKKRVSIAIPGVSTNLLGSSSSFSSHKSSKPSSRLPAHGLPPSSPLPDPFLPSMTYQGDLVPIPVVSFTEREKPSSSKSLVHKKNSGDVHKKMKQPETPIETTEFSENYLDSLSFGSVKSCGRHVGQQTPLTPEIDVPEDVSASVASHFNDFLGTGTTITAIMTEDATATVSGSSKFEMTRNPKNLAIANELVLCPSTLNESKESE